MSIYRDLRLTIAIAAAFAAGTGASAKNPRSKTPVPAIARNEIQAADNGYIIVTAPRAVKPVIAKTTVPLGATIRIDKGAVSASGRPLRSAKQ